jgi:hypothetical protein
MLTDDALRFFTVTVFATLVPTTVFVYERDVGLKVSGDAGAPEPLPFSATTSGLKATPSVTVTAPSTPPF